MSSAKNRFALVTGGAGDIGGEITATLSAAGYETTILDLIDQRVGDDRAAHLTRESAVHFVRASTTDSVEVDRVIATMPQLDLAVMCAGTVTAEPFLDIDLVAWRRQLEVNLTGAFIVSQRAARRMVVDGTKGNLVFISSWVATRPWPEIAAYSSSKAGMDQLMKQAALELSPFGIRSNSVAPGIVMAGLAKSQFENEPQYAARASASIPLGAPQSSQQIADAVGFLASDAASSLTGTVLLVDAGCSLGTMN